MTGDLERQLRREEKPFRDYYRSLKRLTAYVERSESLARWEFRQMANTHNPMTRGAPPWHIPG